MEANKTMALLGRFEPPSAKSRSCAAFFHLHIGVMDPMPALKPLIKPLFSLHSLDSEPNSRHYRLTE